MRDLTEDAVWLRERARDMLTRNAKWRRRLQIWFVLGGIAVAGAGEALSNAVDAPLDSYMYASWIFGLIVAFVGGIILVMTDEGAPETVTRALAAIDEASERGVTLQNLTGEFEWMTRMYRVSIALREYVEAVILAGAGDPKVQTDRLGSMLDIVLAEKHVLLGVRDEAWNFAIYLMNPQRTELECVVCRRPSRTEEEASHRNWKPSEGHVGMAWQLAEELVAPDTSSPELAAYFSASRGQRKEDDAVRYRSIASLPIRMQGEDPAGVLVATSDKEGRYRPHGLSDSGIDNVEPLRVLSTSLAMVLRAVHLHGQGAKPDVDHDVEAPRNAAAVRRCPSGSGDR